MIVASKLLKTNDIVTIKNEFGEDIRVKILQNVIISGTSVIKSNRGVYTLPTLKEVTIERK